MDFLKILKDKKLKATPQRIAVLKALSIHTHPNIDELYEQIKQEYPSVSLATVYKNLNTLRDVGLVSEINVPNSKMRYDIMISYHIHLFCNNCKNIIDLACSDELETYKKSLEKRIDKTIQKIEVIANIDQCSKCLKGV